MWNSRSILAAATLIALLFLGIGILSPEGLPQTKLLQAEAKKLEKQVHKSASKNKTLREEIELLQQTNKDAKQFQEQVIRQELGYIKDDETVLLLPRNQEPPTARSPTTDLPLTKAKP